MEGCCGIRGFGTDDWTREVHDDDGPLPEHHYPNPPMREYIVIYRDFDGEKSSPKTVWAPYPDAIPSVPVEKQHKNFRYWKMWPRELWDAQEG